MTAPYERQDNESDPAWTAFALYRDLGAGRSTPRVARELTKSVTLCKRWSQRHAWVRRARLWDMEIDRRKRETDLDEIEHMRRRHIRYSLDMQAVAETELRKLVSRVSTGAVTLRVQEMLALVDFGTKLERLSRGEPGEIVRSEPSKLDLSILSSDELLALRALRSKLARSVR